MDLTPRRPCRQAPDRDAHDGDPRFERSVVYLCAHGEEGAMGIIVNKPVTELRFADLLEQLGIPRPEKGARDIRVHFGGPVEGGGASCCTRRTYESEGAP
jgi:putative transcriptional regulator